MTFPDPLRYQVLIAEKFIERNLSYRNILGLNIKVIKAETALQSERA